MKKFNLEQSIRELLVEGTSSPDLMSHVQIVEEILEGIKPSTRHSQRNLSIARQHLAEIKRAGRRLMEQITVLEEQVNNLLKIIADLKSQMEEMLAEKAEDEIELKSEVKMSIAEKFSALNKLSNN